MGVERVVSTRVSLITRVGYRRTELSSRSATACLVSNVIPWWRNMIAHSGDAGHSKTLADTW